MADVKLDDLVIKDSFALSGVTVCRTLTIFRNAVLNMRGHPLVVEGWTQVDGTITNAGPIWWQLVRLRFWIRRKLNLYSTH